MRNLWLIARHEYRATVFRRAFILVTLAIPLGLLAISALAILAETSSQNRLPVGYVDRAGVLDLSRKSLASMTTGVDIRAFPDEETALAALESEEIQAFFVLPANYPDALQTDLYYLEKPPSTDVWRDFSSFVRANLVARYPQGMQMRLLEGPDVTVHDIVSKREFSQRDIVNIILPFVASLFFFIATMSASGYMLQAVAAEKENRTMEVMITSVTPGQLIGGKTAGLLAAALTQLAIYVVAAVIGLMIASSRIEALQQLTVPWTYLGVMGLFFFPSYALIAALMVAIGSAVTKIQEAQQISGLLNLLFVLPMLLLVVILRNPGHPVSVFLSLFPTTAFLTISLRWGLGTVPLWQIGVGWISLVATTLFMVWAAARIFRAGMLRYGQPLRLKAAVAVLRRG